VQTKQFSAPGRMEDEARLETVWIVMAGIEELVKSGY